MNDATLKLVFGELRKRHPDIATHVRALTASQDVAVAAAGNALLQILLNTFDEGEQAKWQLRDLLKRVPKGDGTYYLAIKYNATEMVYRIAAASGMGLSEVTYFQDKQPPELTNWKS